MYLRGGTMAHINAGCYTVFQTEDFEIYRMGDVFFKLDYKTLTLQKLESSQIEKIQQLIQLIDSAPAM